MLAVGLLVLGLALVAGYLIFTQANQSSAALVQSLPNEQVGHARGDANAPVTVTEWSDFQ